VNDAYRAMAQKLIFVNEQDSANAREWFNESTDEELAILMAFWGREFTGDGPDTWLMNVTGRLVMLKLGELLEANPRPFSA